ncbi:MAG: trypsin-like peptidase domain-containing protein [Planctomycetota bacterium]|jgi:S1-C subfamily serine protease
MRNRESIRATAWHLVAAAGLFAILVGGVGGAENPLDALGKAFESAASRAAPAVVQVICDRERGSDIPGPGEIRSSFPPEINRKFWERRLLFVRPEGPTSGVIIDPDGYVLTSLYNVAGKVKSIKVITAEGRSLPAEILGSDPNLDVVLLKIDGKNLPFLSLSGGGRPRAGQFALTLGRGADPSELNVNAGIVSAILRARGDAIQTSARVNYGNSGGALVDLSGRLMGVIAKIGHDDQRNRSGINTGVGFAAPVARITEVLSKLKAKTPIKPHPRPFLGIRFDVSYPASEDQKGVRIEYAYGGFPAKKAGLRPGDILVNFDHVDINTRRDLQYVIGQCDPGQRVTFSILRGEESLDLEGVLTARPESAKNALMSREYVAWKAPRALGIRPDPTYPGPGAFVRFVHAGFPLHQGGLRAGDILLGVHGLRGLQGWFPIFSFDYLDRCLQYCFEGAKLTFWVLREGRGRMISLILGRPASPEDRKAMDSVFKEVGPRLPRPPGKDERKALAETAVRWKLWVNLGVHLGALSEEGWKVEFVHKGLPGDRAGLRPGDFLTTWMGESYRLAPRTFRMNMKPVKAADLSKNLGSLAGPMPRKLHWEKGDRWRVGYRRDERKKESRITLSAYPEPAVLTAMQAEIGGKVRLDEGEIKALLAVLRNRSMAGRRQALAAFRNEANWTPSAVETFVSLLDDRDRLFHREVCEILKTHPSRDTLEKVIRALPIKASEVELKSWTDRGKQDVILALLRRAELPGEVPDFGVNGKHWQRWWKENRDRVRFR